MSTESRSPDAAIAGDRAPVTTSLLGRVRAAPYAVPVVAVLAVAAYLCVANLDYAACGTTRRRPH